MPEPVTTITRSWDVLTESVHRLMCAWAQGVPNLEDFVPTVPLPLRRLVKTDLAYRWQKGVGQLLEVYQAQYADLGTVLPCDLILQEYYVRTQYDTKVALEEYYQRFPAQAEALACLLEKTEVAVNTALVTTTAQPIRVGDEVAGFGAGGVCPGVSGTATGDAEMGGA